MIPRASFALPNLVRIKPGALDRLGIYLRRHDHKRILLLSTEGLEPTIGARVEAALAAEEILVQGRISVEANAFESAVGYFTELPAPLDAVVGVGGGKALDLAKYIAFLAKAPYYAVPTSLSNDGFCSPQSSLTIAGRRRSLAAALPFAVVVDTAVCLAAPRVLWLSGVGDLVAKITAIRDWKLAFHAAATPVDDFAALLSDATVYQFIANPDHDLDGLRILATALMLNGIAIAISGSSRPASRSEHLISHALDAVSERPRLHGLQVGAATYIVSRFQDYEAERIGRVLDETGFWDEIRKDPFSRSEWAEAVRLAPTIKENYHTILSSRDCLPELASLLDSDPRLRGCFV